MSFQSASQIRAARAATQSEAPNRDSEFSVKNSVRPELVEGPIFTSSDGGEERAMLRQAQHERSEEDGARITPAEQCDIASIPQTHFTDTTATSSLGHHTIFTPQAQGAFLESLAHQGNVRLACRAASVSAQTAYRARRRSVGFARAWDTALVSARVAAEDALADRALNGWEEPVFYHGEEIARRRRFSDRLLLAHLARLDALALNMEACGEGRADVESGLAVLDDHIDALRQGEDLPEPAPVLPAQSSRENSQDPVPPVPSCRDCGGQCDDMRAYEMDLLGPEDCQWLGNRIDRMELARPPGTQKPDEIADGADDVSAIEALQLEAFEAEGHEWWLVTTHEEMMASCVYGSEEEGE